MDVAMTKTALMADGADPMWAGWAIGLLDALDGTEIDVARPEADLLDAMIGVRESNPKVAAFLVTLPGLPGRRAEAETHLGYLTMQCRHALA